MECVFSLFLVADSEMAAVSALSHSRQQSATDSLLIAPATLIGKASDSVSAPQIRSYTPTLRAL